MKYAKIILSKPDSQTEKTGKNLEVYFPLTGENLSVLAVQPLPGLLKLGDQGAGFLRLFTFGVHDGLGGA